MVKHSRFQFENPDIPPYHAPPPFFKLEEIDPQLGKDEQSIEDENYGATGGTQSFATLMTLLDHAKQKT
ncbi:hypothetical protein LguiA_027455 [Lonicera macranthoides]